MSHKRRRLCRTRWREVNSLQYYAKTTTLREFWFSTSEALSSSLQFHIVPIHILWEPGWLCRRRRRHILYGHKASWWRKFHFSISTSDRRRRRRRRHMQWVCPLVDLLHIWQFKCSTIWMTIVSGGVKKKFRFHSNIKTIDNFITNHAPAEVAAANGK